MLRGEHTEYNLHDYGEILSFKHYRNLRETMFRMSRGYDNLAFNLDVLKASEQLTELNEGMYFITFKMDYQKRSVLPLQFDNYLRADALSTVFFERVARDFSSHILDATIITGDDYYYDHDGNIQVEFYMPKLTIILTDIENDDILSTKIADIYAGLVGFGFDINQVETEPKQVDESKENEDTNNVQ